MRAELWFRRTVRGITDRRRSTILPAVDERLVTDVARVVVARVAPAELPVFGPTSRAYLADPGWLSKGNRRGSGPLSIGTGDVVLLVSPLVLLAVTEVIKYLVDTAVGPAMVRGGSATVRAIRRLFGVDKDTDSNESDGKDTGEQPPGLPAPPRLELTAEQWATVRSIVVDVTRRGGLPDDTVQLIADAVVGAGHSPDPGRGPGHTAGRLDRP